FGGAQFVRGDRVAVHPGAVAGIEVDEEKSVVFAHHEKVAPRQGIIVNKSIDAVTATNDKRFVAHFPELTFRAVRLYAAEKCHRLVWLPTLRRYHPNRGRTRKK